VLTRLNLLKQVQEVVLNIRVIFGGGVAVGVKPETGKKTK
jgi:hypothetical protein